MDMTILAHDLNNDVTVLNGLIHVLESALESGNIDLAKEKVKKLKARSRTIITTLKSAMEPIEEIDVKAFYESHKEDMEENYGVCLNIKGKSGFNVYAKRVFFLKFIENVIKNSKEAKATKVDIHVSNQYMVIKDNGAGFNSDILRSFRDDRARVTTKSNGHGIGLQSMKLFAKKINASIDLSNNPISGGAEIRITLKNS